LPVSWETLREEARTRRVRASYLEPLKHQAPEAPQFYAE
jgi:hypothetical protein